MDKYNIIDLENSDYDILVIMYTANSPMDILSLIYDDLKSRKSTCKILIDEILHVGNTEKRFISLDFNKDEQFSNIKFVNVNKGDVIRKISCKYLNDNNLIEYSILSSIQKRMMSKGIAL